MTREEVFQIWASAESIWSPWAIPVPFAQMICVGKDIPFDLSGLAETADRFDAAPDLAMVLDLPGDKAIKLGLALAQKEFRPVPLIDGRLDPA
jgi:hypothetical protein